MVPTVEVADMLVYSMVLYLTRFVLLSNSSEDAPPGIIAIIPSAVLALVTGLCTDPADTSEL